MSDREISLPGELGNLRVFEYKGQAVADSRDVAALLGKYHHHILRTIDTMYKHLSETKIGLADFFIKARYKDGQGKFRPCYYLTEMGCEMVAHKQTGEAGTIFTAKYVQAFHAMEDFIKEKQSIIWQDTRALGKKIRQTETDAIRQLVDYATAQGSTSATRYYTSISRLANRTAGVTDRDNAHTTELAALLMVENVIAKEIQAGINAGVPYKAIYSKIKARLEPLQLAAVE